MKIRVKNKDEKINILLFFPLWVIKTKLVASLINNYGKVDINKEDINNMYNIIKEYIKENGHFTMVEVETEDGTYVKIRV